MSNKHLIDSDDENRNDMIISMWKTHLEDKDPENQLIK